MLVAFVLVIINVFSGLTYIWRWSRGITSLSFLRFIVLAMYCIAIYWLSVGLFVKGTVMKEMTFGSNQLDKIDPDPCLTKLLEEAPEEK